MYIHIPFCRRFCHYCHFYKQPYSSGLARATVTALGKELKIRAATAPPADTLYFGGGSPSLLPPRQLGRLLDAAALHCSVAAGAEITIEANPEDLSLAQARELRGLGFNRLSIGVQSFQPGELHALGRSHDPQTAVAAVRKATRAGFINVSVDLLIGIRGQTKSSLEKSLLTARRLDVPHVSVYILEGLPGRARRTAAGRDAELYTCAQAILAAAGYEQYEVSNFSRTAYRGRHNLKYWQNLPYLGIGPAAASYLDGVDACNRPDLDSYLCRLEKGHPPRQRVKTISPAVRRLITGLRLREGLPPAAFAAFPEPTRFLLQNGMLHRHRGRLFIPQEKILLTNEILLHFI